MIIKAQTTEAVVGVSLFGTSAIILYTMSCLYHSFKRESVVKRVFRRFDHASIYLLIGGTYLPVFLIVFKHPIDIYFIVLQWAIIITGVTLKSARFNKFKAIHFILYLILGWSGILVFKPLYQASPEAFYWILAGGVSYTLGTIFYGFRKFKYNHFYLAFIRIRRHYPPLFRDLLTFIIILINDRLIDKIHMLRRIII